MNIGQPSYLIFFAAVISLYLSFFAWKRRQDPAIKSLSWLLLASAVWSVGYALEVGAVYFNLIQFFGFVAYVGIVTTPVLWLIFSAQYTHHDAWLSGNKKKYLFVVPALSLISIVTNDKHSLFYSSVGYRSEADLYFQVLEYGPLWYLHSAYSYLCGLTGLVFMFKMLGTVSSENRHKILYFIVGSLIPYFVNFLYIIGYRPYGFLDLTPVAFILMGALLMLGVYKFQLLDIKPLALDLLFDHIPDAIFVLDEKRQITNTNPAARMLLSRMQHGEKSENKAPDAGFDIGFMLDTDDTDFIIQDRIYYRSYSQIKSKGDQKAGTLIILRDITEAKKTEKTLIESEQRFRLILENMPILLNAFDEKGQIIVWNKACERCSGWSAEEVIHNEKAMEWLYPDETYRKTVIASSLDPSSPQNTFTLQTKNGKQRIVSWFDIYHRLKVPGWHSWGLGIDVTEQKQVEAALFESEKQLRELNSSKDRFFSIIAHDLRSPFNSILGISELMKEFASERDFESIERFTDVLHTTSRNTFELLVNLLEWAQSQTGRMEFLPEYFELVSVIEEEIKLLEQVSASKGVSITLKFTGKMLVFADKQMVSTIIRNLITNAIKFSYPQDTVVISGSKRARGMVVSITDQGVGISPEDQKKLFRLDETLTTKGTMNEKGTGLGLILCKELVERHQGEIWVESRPGSGSTFSFTLPVLSTEL